MKSISFFIATLLVANVSVAGSMSLDIELLGKTSTWTVDGTPYEDTYSYYCTRDLVKALEEQFSLPEATKVMENVNCGSDADYIMGKTTEELKKSLQKNLRRDIAEMLKKAADSSAPAASGSVAL